MTDINSIEKSSQSQGPFSVPMAIVIAGGLIAAAIYFSHTPPQLAEEVAQAPSAGAVENGQQPPAAPPANPPAGNVAGTIDPAPVTDEDHMKGAKNPKVTVIEYSDLECPFCKRFHPTMQQLVEEFPNDVRWVYRHFPLEQLHPNARIAAIATECAAEQGKFWEFTDYIFENTSTGPEIAEANLPKLAQAAGVTNMSQFQACLSSDKYNDDIDADLADAQKAGGRGTPHSVIIGPNGETEVLSGAQPYSAVKAAVEKYL